MLVNTIIAQSDDIKSRNKVREVYMSKEVFALMKVRSATEFDQISFWRAFLLTIFTQEDALDKEISAQLTIYNDELELDHKEMSGQVAPKDVAAHFTWLMDSTVGQEMHDELGAIAPSLFKLRNPAKYGHIL